VNVPTPWPLTATRTSWLTDTARVPWTAGAGEEEAGEEEAGAEEAGADDHEPGVELAAPDVPGAGREPGLVAPDVSGAGAIVPPGLADGAPLPPTPGEEPGPRDGAPRLFATTPGPALPRPPAAGTWDGDPPPMTSTALTPAAAAVAALATRA
jgi:hypothetical protein